MVEGILRIFLTQTLSFVVMSVSGDAPLYQASKLTTWTFDRWATCAQGPVERVDQRHLSRVRRGVE